MNGKDHGTLDAVLAILFSLLMFALCVAGIVGVGMMARIVIWMVLT